MNILLVDDEELALGYMENLLLRTEEAANVYKFSDPMQAKKIIEFNHVDVLFLDIEMAELNGFELADYYQKSDPNIDVVFVTAHREFALDAFELDAADYLVKPVRFERLCNTMERLKKRKKRMERTASENKLYLNIKNGTALGYGINQTEEVAWRTTKARELFFYLLHHYNEKVSKAEIIEAMWHDQDIKKAFSQLYTTIYHIRKELKPYAPMIKLETKDDGYCLKLNDVQVDLFNWKQRLISVENLQNIENRQDIEDLLEAYKGDYMTHSTHLWATEERQQQKILWREKALDLAFYYQSQNSYTNAFYWYQKILQQDELDEEVHLNIMKLHALRNRDDLVKKHYSDLVQALKTELDVPPDPLIENWYTQWLSRG
ncbi:response regulator [Salisediminibacterium halotolerans]|uniref:Two-component response regulator, SAPR family, consists of REC, wHTH and BTAD domains n=1 Tax=Salisediminibacterium halotolerans TaxID=517425 RepID=A0A1H9W9S6_9BACI|nr:response regulator [Salisediminibacterium haloalkalitolerans]SES30648.1 Two-component response regulator, SAPR family, consists of REC, wHTH and BTAD domains [Salisediminibacterium haloalkalitolerans]